MEFTSGGSVAYARDRILLRNAIYCLALRSVFSFNQSVGRTKWND